MKAYILQKIVRQNAENTIVIPNKDQIVSFYHHVNKEIEPMNINKSIVTPTSGITPENLITAYNLTIKNKTTFNPTIVIVNAFCTPTIANDLNVFSQAYGLPLMNIPNQPVNQSLGTLKIYYQQPNGTFGLVNNNVVVDTDWGVEIAMDIQYAHAIAPYADISLILTKDNSVPSMYAGVQFGNTLSNVVSMSMSWGLPERFAFNTSISRFTTQDNLLFSKKNILYCAATGDDGAPAGVIYPSTSSNVCGVGGTSLQMNSSNQIITPIRETGWSGSGGGRSSIFNSGISQSNYMITNKLTPKFGTKHAVPDMCLLANPSVCIYNTTPPPGTSSGWGFSSNGKPSLYGGTSLSAPMFAAMVALVIQTKYPTENWTILNLNIRKIIMDSVYILSNNRDITTGSNGFNASIGFDLVTGMGSPLFNNLSQYILNNFTKLSGLKN